MVNGVQILESHHAWNELLKCKNAGLKYQVWFREDEASIRADQAKAEADRERKEKAQEEQRRREEAERKIREDAEKKRADDLERRKEEYWNKSNGEEGGEE